MGCDRWIISIPRFPLEESLYEIAQGNIFVMEREDTGEVCAANKMVVRGGMVSTWLGAVKAEYRRMGLSTAMKQLIYKTAQERGIRCAIPGWTLKHGFASWPWRKWALLPRGVDGGFLLDAARIARIARAQPMFNPCDY